MPGHIVYAPHMSGAFEGMMVPLSSSGRHQNNMDGSAMVLGMMICMLGMQACATLPSEDKSPNPVVGAWFVKDTDAPFPYHMYVFNGGRTMKQANPDAGDPQWKCPGVTVNGRTAKWE
jgi:hypothetical protein